ncbi:PREDICTED: uncharacterized protein LOC109464227 [Branchiostoma belcheri]|uniref:Uncharacterized protein LOC109464227 n=1 Tax=Branchiostoma belcheri TaxID=7741 RepID=A0A6P4Y2S2_BRABE|nr:PREDICTED: uncharacterized protein LOC109464227 [Branchiostoma belcheri]
MYGSSPLQQEPCSPALSPIHHLASSSGRLESDTSKSLNDVFAFNEPDTPYSPVILSPRNQHQEDDDASSKSSTASEATQNFSDSDMESTYSDNLDSSYFTEPQVRPKPLNTNTKGEEKRSKLLSRAIHSSALRKVAALEPCCKKKCSDGYSRSTIKDKRTDYFSAPSRNEWIKQKLGSFQVGSDKRAFQFKVNGSEVCREAWCRIYGINKNTYYRELNNFRMGLEWAGLRQGRSLSSKCISISVWFGHYVAIHGDKMPHKEEIWLPYNTRKVDIFNKYAEDCEDRSEPYCCLQSFLNMWKTFYPHVAIKKCSLFTKCTICVRLGRDLAKTRDPVKRRKIKLKRQEHDARQMAERLAYYQRREAARQEPDKYLSLIIDGMDQAKTYLPHFVGDKSKDLTTADLMKVHVSGIISHGHGLRATYVDFFEYSHDSNLTLNLLLKLLAKLSTGSQLPPILFIQADNCYRENKNKFMLAFLDLLVHKRIFREIQLSFLMVGHTHEDIDQMFSRVADKLRHQEAHTPEQLINMMPECSRLRGLYNIRDWLKPSVSMIKGQSQPGQFRFRLSKDDPDSVDMFYRKGQGQDWKKLKTGMFKRSKESGKPIRPKGIPKIIPVSFDNRNINAQKLINEQLPKWAPYLGCDQEHYMWEQHLKQMVKAGSSAIEMAKYSKVGTMWALPKLPKYPEESVDEEPAVPDDLRRLLEKEQENPEITVSGASAAAPRTTTRRARRRLVD